MGTNQSNNVNELVSLGSGRVGKLFVVVPEMCLVVRILLEPLVVIDVSKHDLAEAVKVRDVGQLSVNDPVHKSSGLVLVVDLGIGISSSSKWQVGKTQKSILDKENQCVDFGHTCVHRTIPYLTIRSCVMGAETVVMYLR